MARIAILLITLLAFSGEAVDKAAAEVMAETDERHMLVARYYVSRRDYAGAINRFRIVIARFPSSAHVPEAMAGLTEAYRALGIAPPASRRP